MSWEAVPFDMQSEPGQVSQPEQSGGAAAERGRPRSPWRKLWILLFIGLPLGLVAGELGARALLAARGQTYDGQATRDRLVELRSRVTDSLPRPGDLQELDVKLEERTKIIHPFVAFDELGSHDQLERDKRERSTRDPEVYRIVILGGSVSGLFSLQGAAHLREAIQGSPALAGRRVEFMGYARGGYKQPQQLIRLMQLLISGVRPDAVLNIDGFNEVAIGNKNRAQKMDPTYPSYSHWMRFAKALGEDEAQHDLFLRTDRSKLELVDEIDAALATDAFWSALWGHQAQLRVGRARRDYEGLRDGYMELLKKGGVAPGVLGPRFKGTVTEAIEECVAQWMESSRQIQMLCDQYDMDYLHVLQPTLHDPGAKPIVPSEVEKGAISKLWGEGVLLGYPLLRERGAELARGGIEFFDASRVFAEVKEPLYYDSCHFNKLGNRLLAEAIAVPMLRLLDRK